MEKKKEMSYATFAGGCFWCMVPPFQKLNGVIEVIAGYSGGNKKNPSYEEVSSGNTGHLEAVQITYDSTKINYVKLLDTFWQSIDPTDNHGQFADKGSQYKTAILYHNTEQKRLAMKSKSDLAKKFDKPIATQVIPFKEFYPAEEYHQDYYKKNPIRYNLYKVASGRESYLKKVWSDRERRKTKKEKKYTLISSLANLYSVH